MTRDSLNSTYKSGYVLALFDTLVCISSLSELESNISKFLHESMKEVQLGTRVTNRLQLLDEIGLIINDVITIRCSDCRWDIKDRHIVKDSFSHLKSIFERYNYTDDRWNSIFSDCEHFLSFSDCKFFITKQNANIGELSVKEIEAIKSIKELEKKYSLYSAFSELYSGKNNRYAGDRFYSLMRNEFDRRCSAFFVSYSSENEDDTHWKKAFEKLKDPENPLSSPYGVSVHKRCFIMFPLCAEDSVGKWFWGTTWTREKNGWRHPPKTKEKKTDKLHHFSNLTSTKKYDGLFGLIAWAGLIRINNEK